jgi:AcrR family transcriptional regulator
MTDPEVAPSASALRLVVAAERLFAIHGIEGVSLRQIAVEAGSGNNSAVHYHFGSKDGLIAAIFQHRLPQLIGEQRLLATRCAPGDLRSRLEAQFLPVFALAESTDNHYVSYVEQLMRRQAAFGPHLLDVPAEGARANDEFRRDVEQLLDHLDERLRMMRIGQAQALCLHAAADRERAVATGDRLWPFELFVNSFFDGVTGFLSASPSDATTRRLRGHGDGTPSRRSDLWTLDDERSAP